MKHVPNCTRVFKRYDSACPRCRELQAGAPARRGWGPYHTVQRAWRTCSHNDPNPGGYCYSCGAGRDHS